MKKNHTIIKALIWFVFVLLLIIVVLSVVSVSVLPRILTVESGSMEPSLSRGSLILVNMDNDYAINEIVTYIDTLENGQEVLITHRIIEVNQTDNVISYITKGDANDTHDLDPIEYEMIIGKMIFSIPLLGFIVSFAKTKLGVILLIVIPCLILAYGEIKSIKKEVKEIKLKKKAPLLFIILFSLIISIPITYSLFSDKAEIKGNIITIGEFPDEDVHCGVRTGNPHEDKCRKPHPVPDRPGNPFNTDNNPFNTQEISETDNTSF